jgi:hypothetical protein
MTQHPFDLHSHLAWLRERELEAQNAMSTCKTWEMEQLWNARKKAFREVIDHIENQPKLLHRCMVPVGWEEVDG